jgi:hypothetical protein
MIEYLSNDFARCASNPLHTECNTCMRNVKLNPVKPETRQVWIGFWVLDTPCASHVQLETSK